MIEFVWKKKDITSFEMLQYMTQIMCYLFGEIDEYFTEDEKNNLKFGGYLSSFTKIEKKATLLLFDSKYPELQERILGYLKQPSFAAYCKAVSIGELEDAHIYDYDDVDGEEKEKESPS